MKKQIDKCLLILGDIFLINLAYFLSLYIRFEGVIGDQFLSYLPKFLHNAIYITIIKIIIFYYFKLYKTIWKYASIEELLNIVTAIIVSNAAILSFLFIRGQNLPRSIYILVVLIDMVFIGGLRFSFRAIGNKHLRLFKKYNQKRIMIIGAGDAGDELDRKSVV